MKFILSSGKELEITVSDVKTSFELFRAWKKSAMQAMDIIDIVLYPEVLKCILECGKKAIYDGRRCDSLETFEDDRKDMFEAFSRILGENINPFSDTPLISYTQTPERKSK